MQQQATSSCTCGIPLRGVLLRWLCVTYSRRAVYIQQQTDALVRTRTSLGKVNSSPRGDNFDSYDDRNSPACFFYSRKQTAVEKNSAFSSLIDSRRIVPTHAVGVLNSSSIFWHFLAFLQINSKSHHGGNRTQGSTQVLFEGSH